ncbi:hypothetical protein cco16_02101 [Campylobacter coli 86119]|nr:hypothetical protein cco16_02101 [Campylobacter coli 86119]
MLGFIDRFLTLWIFLAIFFGFNFRYHFPQYRFILEFI